MRRLAGLCFLFSLVLIGCSGSPSAEPLDPLTLLQQAVETVRAKQSFRILVDHDGADYFFVTDFGNLIFRRADGQFAAPDKIQARVRVVFGGLPIDVDIFARGEDQWLRGIWTNQQWQNMIVVEGFNPDALINREDTGIGVAINALVDPQIVGEEQLEDGTPVYHIKATASGEEMSWLVVYLIQMTGQVNVDIYIHRDTKLPVRFIIEQPDTVTDGQPDPTTWTIDLYDFDQPPQLDEPPAEAAVEMTAEATPEATIQP